MFKNPRRGRQARHFTTNVSKTLDLKSSSERIFFRKLSLGAPVSSDKNLVGCKTAKTTAYVKLSIIKQSANIRVVRD